MKLSLTRLNGISLILIHLFFAANAGFTQKALESYSSQQIEQLACERLEIDFLSQCSQANFREIKTYLENKALVQNPTIMANTSPFALFIKGIEQKSKYIFEQNYKSFCQEALETATKLLTTINPAQASINDFDFGHTCIDYLICLCKSNYHNQLLYMPIIILCTRHGGSTKSHACSLNNIIKHAEENGYKEFAECLSTLTKKCL